MLATIASKLHFARKSSCTVALVTFAIFYASRPIQANMLIFSTCSHRNFTCVTNKSIRADAVFKVLIVRHVEIRNGGTEIELVKKANVLGTFAAVSTMLTLQGALLIITILFLVLKLAYRTTISFRTVASDDTVEIT